MFPVTLEAPLLPQVTPEPPRTMGTPGLRFPCATPWVQPASPLPMQHMLEGSKNVWFQGGRPNSCPSCAALFPSVNFGC